MYVTERRTEVRFIISRWQHADFKSFFYGFAAKLEDCLSLEDYILQYSLKRVILGNLADKRSVKNACINSLADFSDPYLFLFIYSKSSVGQISIYAN